MTFSDLHSEEVTRTQLYRQLLGKIQDTIYKYTIREIKEKITYSFTPAQRFL